MNAESYIGRGLPFDVALARAPIALTREIVGEPLQAVLRLMDADLVSDEKLRALAKDMVDPIGVLVDVRTREQLVDSLPVAKIQELAGAFDVSREPLLSLPRRLHAALAQADNLTPLFEFFGLASDERAAGVHRPATLELEAGYGLFPHQRTAARRTLSQLDQEPRRVLLHMPTGAGKTRTAMHVVCDHLRTHGPSLVIWLANSPELLEQAAEEVQNAWRNLGDRSLTLARYWGSFAPDLGNLRDGVLVGGLQKLHALLARNANDLLRLGDRTTLTVVDEAHQAIAPTYRNVIEALSQKHPQGRLLGLSATPGRTWADIDADAKLSEFFGRRKVTLEVPGYPDPVEYLMAEGYLARPTFRTLNHSLCAGLSCDDKADLASALDVPPEMLEQLGEDEQRNLKIVTEVEDLLRRHRRIIVFAASVRHAHLVRAVLTARGHEALVVTGDMNPAVRERAIRRYKGNAPDPIVMCNFGVLTTGFDAPKTSAAVIARPTRSLVLYSQMVGRATRGPRAGGNAEAEIVTVVDPDLPGFGDVAEAFKNWEDIWRG